MRDSQRNRKITALLVDDEPEAIRGLQETLSIFCPDIEVIDTASSVKEGADKVREHGPALVFLDIQMRDGLGFDLLEQVSQRTFSTIFVTAHDQYALRALRMNAMDYLLKPVDTDELVAAVDRVRSVSGHPDYSHLLLSHARGSFTKLGVPGSRGTTYIELDDIVRLESSNNYTYIHFTNTKPMLVARTIKSFAEMLPERFVRCHQRHIIGMDHVKELVRSENSFVILTDGTEVPVSRANKSLVEQSLRGRFPSL